MKDLRIVVAEDETLVALSIIAQLKELGYQVVGDATDGGEAVELCEALRPDLVVMDISMPRVNGIQAAEIIKEKWLIPVVIVSGYSDENLIREAAAAGVFSYLIKPVTKQNLAPAIEVALRNHAAYCEAREESSRLREQLEERKLIERAKGILMEKQHLTEAEAMKKLQKLSNARNVKLAQLAREVIAANQLLS
ncbi:response regulator receiver and ANTAR domain protein [Hydrogenispora ethanolica]|jgi:response regulator NasT|uniref:Response regulator receiver and ANTAR domain protein n=1 Tax=Hydrogenispora ethanolica TaxID=1082276 RepID=A0A4R1SA32_HYDET|nr:response regulator [Hydrogenispora ethanolica]TCL76288.1 response regulator receiver and ANTAR domain protein [Hydrogenispora ethanolica]